MDTQHEMRLERTLKNGQEEWYCPTCGRRFLLRWPPAYAKEVLDPGDEYAIHIGGKGGVQLGSAQLAETDAAVDDLFAGHELAPLADEFAVADEFSVADEFPVANEFAREETTAAYEAPSAEELSDEEIELSDDLLGPWMSMLDQPTDLDDKT